MADPPATQPQTAPSEEKRRERDLPRRWRHLVTADTPIPGHAHEEPNSDVPDYLRNRKPEEVIAERKAHKD